MTAEAPLTKLGNLDPKLASAICYLPIMYVHVIASLAFLMSEPKENRKVRFHAIQSLLVSGIWIVSMVLAAVIAIFLPLLVIFGGAILGGMLGSESILGLSTLLGFVVQAASLVLFVAAALGGPLVLLAGAGMVMTDMEGRIPMVASVADRFAG